MALTVETEMRLFDTNNIQRGDFIRLKRNSDDNYVNGLVASVTPTKLTFFYLPQMTNVTNYIVICIDDIDDWYNIVWSGDMNTVNQRGGADGTA